MLKFYSFSAALAIQTGNNLFSEKGLNIFHWQNASLKATPSLLNVVLYGFCYLSVKVSASGHSSSEIAHIPNEMANISSPFISAADASSPAFRGAAGTSRVDDVASRI